MFALPNFASSEYFPGPVMNIEIEPARMSRMNSYPPVATENPFVMCTKNSATSAMTISMSDTQYVKRPRMSNIPPTSSPYETRNAMSDGRGRPRFSMEPVTAVDPMTNTFWYP